jgi:hypothetical protein
MGTVFAVPIFFAADYSPFGGRSICNIRDYGIYIFRLLVLQPKHVQYKDFSGKA